jgi:hypothetical protein
MDRRSVRHVAGELSGPQHRDRLRHLAGLVHDIDLAGLDDEELEIALEDTNEGLPGPELLERRSRASAERGHLRFVEPGKRCGVQVVRYHVTAPSHGLAYSHVGARLRDFAERPTCQTLTRTRPGLAKLTMVPAKSRPVPDLGAIRHADDRSGTKILV